LQKIYVNNLMKRVVFLFFIFVFELCSAQQSGNIALKWLPSSYYTIGEQQFFVPKFESDSYNFDAYNKELLYIKKISTSSFINEDAITISNIIYQDIDINDLKDLDKNKIPSNLVVTAKNSLAREEISLILKFNPIIKEGNSYKKVISFDYSFNTTNANKITETQNPSTIVNSALNSGSWHRFYVERSGVYKIDKGFLNSIGFNADNFDPRKIKIYGNGGRMIPIKNSDYYPDDLAENAIQIIGEEDGVFNNEDYILLYAEGMDNWSDENYTHLNLYADKSFYYVTYDGSNGKRIELQTQPTTAPTVTLTDFDDYQFHEVDLVNIGRLGRVWFGDNFSIENEKEFSFNFPNINTAKPTTLTIHVGDVTFTNTSFAIAVNGAATGTMNLTHTSGGSTIELAHNENSYAITPSQNYTIKLTYNNNNVPTSKGYLDFIKIKASSNLVGYGKQYRFQYNDAIFQSGVVQYQFSNASGITQIWDITDIYNVSKFENTNQSNFSFKANLGSTKKYIAVDPADYYSPIKDQTTSIANQNLKGTIFYDNFGNFIDIDYIIVTPSFLYSQADRLANFYRNYASMNVKVVTLDAIYQEFGGGKQDIGAIRNFVKYVYNNASTPADRLKYLNLFGDASFDFKSRIPNSINTNIVPIYHAVNSYTNGDSASFATDEYYALLDNTDNDPVYSINGLDIAVGRMLVASPQQADEMVNKVIEYHDIQSYGNWRNNYVAIADDPDSFKVADVQLQYYQNLLVDNLYAQKPFINFKKILMDSYQQETSAGGERYPKVKEDIKNAFEKGALVFNYLGHGGEDGLSQERIWDKFDGYDFYNKYKYPLFITLTCEFSRFDNPYRPTAGEYTYWNPKGGAIAMITTIRTIGQGEAQNFNEVLSSKLFSYGSNTYYSIAESLRQAKNNFNDGSAKRVISFLGDPALKLAIPEPKVVLTKVNDVPVTQPIDDFKALSYVKITGEVQDEMGNLLTNYNGELAVNVFDKNYTRNTLRNDGVDAIVNMTPYTTASTLPFNSLGETIFRGNASVVNGNFEFGFIVPKDIKIPLGNGRISFYAKRNQLHLDKTGYNLDIKVGGINANAVADETPPKVRLYMNDETFINGGITNQSPYFLAFLEDEHGINTASGIGHDIVAILDGNESNPYILNDYYETELNDYTHGKIRFPFRNLSVGLHTITFKAWDVYNNLIVAEIQFVVVSDEDVTLTNVLNYPNPFVNYTEFWFTHNKPYEPLEVQVQIITITGKIVKTINETITTEGFLSRSLTWNGLDDYGDKIGKGVYVYKLTVKSSVTGKKTEKIEKLVIL
jgi:hypothetical protein